MGSPNLDDHQPSLTHQDYLALGISTLIFPVPAGVSIFINHSRFYNPFVYGLANIDKLLQELILDAAVIEVAKQ